MDRGEFVETLMGEYDKCIKRHIDVMSTGNSFSTSPDLIITILDIWTTLNSLSPPGTVANVNFLDQLKFVIPIGYWIGASVVGPLGRSQVLFPGIWLPVPLQANTNFMIMLSKISNIAILHLKTMFGLYTNSATGVVLPWSGASLLTPG
jgi:hypothetical protein